MSYTKHDFKSGEILRAEQLNEMEDELAQKQDKPEEVNFTITGVDPETETLFLTADKTFLEVAAMVNAGKKVVGNVPTAKYNGIPCSGIAGENGTNKNAIFFVVPIGQKAASAVIKMYQDNTAVLTGDDTVMKLEEKVAEMEEAIAKVPFDDVKAGESVDIELPIQWVVQNDVAMGLFNPTYTIDFDSVFTPNSSLELKMNDTVHIMQTIGIGMYISEDRSLRVGFALEEGVFAAAIQPCSDTPSIEYIKIRYSDGIAPSESFKGWVLNVGKWKSLALGLGAEANERCSYAFGSLAEASGEFSFAFGDESIASGPYSVAIGNGPIASGHSSFAEGFMCEAAGSTSHAEGYRTYANGSSAHASGSYSQAIANQAYAEGWHTQANKKQSHAEGYFTIADGDRQHVQGKYNIPDSDSKYAHIVGNGSAEGKRSNAHTLDWDGNAWFAGNVEASGGKLKIGNTEITEVQLQELINMLR